VGARVGVMTMGEQSGELAAAVLLGFLLGCMVCRMGWHVTFPQEVVRLLVASGCSVAAARRGGPEASTELVLCTRKRVWPLDLDFLLHMNNVRYFHVVQADRMQFLFRSGAPECLAGPSPARPVQHCWWLVLLAADKAPRCPPLGRWVVAAG
jgi:hypothetical protein